MSGEGNLQIHVCSDDPIFGPALSNALNTHMVTIYGTGDSDNLLGADLGVWHQPDATRATELGAITDSVKVIAVATGDLIFDYVQQGCDGFVDENATLDEMVDAIDVVAGGGAYVPGRLLGTLLRGLVDQHRNNEKSPAPSSLTTREAEVYALAVKGLRRDAIASELYISSGTVRTHLQRIYKKLEVHSQAELMAKASSPNAGER